MLDGSLRRHKHGAHVHGENSIEVREREIVDRAESQHARVVDQDINAAQFANRALDCCLYRAGIGTVCLNCEGPYSERLCRLRNFAGPVGRTGIGQRNVSAFASQTFDDGCADAPAAAGDKAIFPWSLSCEFIRLLLLL